MRDYLKRLEIEKGRTDDMNMASGTDYAAGAGREPDYSSFDVRKDHEASSEKLADYFIRAKTTSINSEKYA